MSGALPQFGDAGDIRRLYLDLLKAALIDTLYPDVPTDAWVPFESVPGEAPRRWLRCSIAALLARRGLALWRLRGRQSREGREEGREWPSRAMTMVGLKRLQNIEDCLAAVVGDGVPGDFVETGVWRGGASIFARGVLRAYGAENRRVWLADSFRGLPPPNAALYPQDAGDRHHAYEELRVGLDEVRENFHRFGLLDAQVQFLEGWFSDTLPHAPIERIAVLRLDGDMYESTITALCSLYDRVSSSGYVIVDDYGAVHGCRCAVEDFRASREIREPLVTIDQAGVFWRKE